MEAIQGRCDSDKHEWGNPVSVFPEPNFGVSFGSAQTCVKCGWQRFNDYAATRVGGVQKLMPPNSLK